MRWLAFRPPSSSKRGPLVVLALAAVGTAAAVLSLVMVSGWLVVLWLVRRVGGMRPRRRADHGAPMYSTPPSVRPRVNVATDQIVGPFNVEGYYDAVFEGGGMKSVAQIGAVKRLEAAALTPRRLAGTSGGALLAAMLAAGARSDEAWEILAGLDLQDLLDARWTLKLRALRLPLIDQLPVVSGAMVRYGAVQGDAFVAAIDAELRRLTGQDREVTFGDLANRVAGARLQIVATDVTRRRAITLPDDAGDYCVFLDGHCERCSEGGRCLTPESLSVALAVRMSMSIPFLIEPVRLRIRGTDVVAHIVDGAASSSFPIWLFDSREAPAYPTFGFLLDEALEPAAAGAGHRPPPPRPIRNLAGFTAAIVSSGIGSIDRIHSAHDRARTIRIPTLGVGTTDFDLSPQTRADLYTEGYYAADRHLARFNWHEYVREFRSGLASVPAEYEGGDWTERNIDGVLYRRQPGRRAAA